ncbi:MAG TPA: phosphodiester glycosidase family protein [Kofleriaceae bacterium]|nr:phosphodiester glycosidase family protein [Kofleriaceae bacterium]
MRLTLLGVILCALPVAAAAADKVTAPYDGVRHIVRTTDTPNRIHIVEVDLSHPKVRVRATRSADRQRAVSSFADLVGCQIAVNGDFFSFDDYSTSGLSIGGGEPWPDSPDTGDSGFVAIGRDNRAQISDPSPVVAPAGWMSDAVGGHPLIVRDGARIPFEDCTGLCERNPRTAVGLSRDGETLYLVVVDGRSSSSVGMSLDELGALMVDIGAHRALNLDGGGSSTMFVRNQGGVQNAPSDGSQRVVANHLAVCVVPPVGTVQGFVRAVDIQDEAAGMAGVEVALSSGQRAVSDERGFYLIEEVPRGDVVVSAAAQGFAPVERAIYVTAADVTWGSIAMIEGGAEPDAGVEPDDGDVEDPVGGCTAASLSGAASGSGAVMLGLALVILAVMSSPRRGRRPRAR